MSDLEIVFSMLIKLKSNDTFGFRIYDSINMHIDTKKGNIWTKPVFLFYVSLQKLCGIKIILINSL